MRYVYYSSIMPIVGREVSCCNIRGIVYYNSIARSCCVIYYSTGTARIGCTMSSMNSVVLRTTIYYVLYVLL
jgi:hypothetical protein